jgi:hypothetical protein
MIQVYYSFQPQKCLEILVRNCFHSQFWLCNSCIIILQVCGFKAPSPLLQLPNFDVVNGISIDSMHCIYLGVVKQLIGLWFNSKHSGEKWYCGKSVDKVDKRLLEIKPPGIVTTVPRSIEHHLKFWKGIY